MNDQKLKKKNPSLLRWESIFPITIISALVAAYFILFFDMHLKSALEVLGYHLNGAEVNIATLKTDFIKATLRIQKIEFTNADAPKKNALSIDTIEFGALWDAILRGRIVVNQINVLGLQVQTPRKKVGKVKPPPPPPQSGPSLLDAESSKVFQMGLHEIETKYQDNALVSAIGLMSVEGKSEFSFDQKLKSKTRAEEISRSFQERQNYWDKKIKELPTQKDLDQLKVRFEKIKTKDFKSPEELQTSLRELDSVIKEADQQFQKVQSSSQEFQTDIASLDKDLKSLDQLIKEDAESLKSLFKLPNVDAQSLSRSIFLKYLIQKLSGLTKYIQLAEKYLPRSLTQELESTLKQKAVETLSKGTKKPAPDDLQAEKPNSFVTAHPRAKGMVYEFSTPKSYPLFWIKKIEISSKASETGEPGLNNLNGQIENIVSDQRIIGKPTTLSLKGDLSEQQIRGLDVSAMLDFRKNPSLIQFQTKINQFPVLDTPLIQSQDLNLKLKNSEASSNLSGSLIGFKKLELTNQFSFLKLKYEVESNHLEAKNLLEKVFSGIPLVHVNFGLHGDLPNLNLYLNSNLGEEIQRGIQRQVQARIDEAKKQLDSYIQKEVGAQRDKIETEVKKLRSQLEGDLNKTKAQIEKQKSLASNKMENSKKDAENQAKKQAEQQLQKDAGKAVEDLKKKFGF